MNDDAPPEADRIDGAPHPRDAGMLYGHTDAESDFLEAYNDGRLPHAWIIGGPRGIGKATLAWRIARFLLSDPAIPADSLTVAADHPVTKRLHALSEPGLFLCRRPWDAKTKRLKTVITVEEVRALKRFFTLSAPDGRWRVAIIDAADEMNNNAANALLKVLEEPPAKVVLLLVTHQPARLLPTIRSRARMLRLGPLSPDDLNASLNNAGFDTQNIAELAELSAGAPGEAIRLLAEDGVRLYAKIIGLFAQMPNMDRGQINGLADACSARGNAAVYDLTVRLILLALTRLARYGVTGAMTEAAASEREMMQRHSCSLAHAQDWADLHAELDKRITHARAVNLDPGQVILDTCLRIESVARNRVA